MSRRRRRNQVKDEKGTPGSLYPTLDLHGLIAAEAERATLRWLEERSLAGDATVVVVTGRGLHSIGPAVLPQTIEDLLRRMTGELVRGFDRRPGGGAYLVRLIRAPHAAPPTAPPPRLDPTLVRAAEAALAELAVSPTPALVEAEVRRLLRERRPGPG